MAASGDGLVDEMRVQPSLLRQVSSCSLKGHLVHRLVKGLLDFTIDSLTVGTNSSSIQPLEHFILTSYKIGKHLEDRS